MSRYIDDYVKMMVSTFKPVDWDIRLAEEGRAPLPIPTDARTTRVAARVREALRPHARTLSSRRAQLLLANAYGAVDRTRWLAEMKTVYASVLAGRIDLEGVDAPESWEPLQKIVTGEPGRRFLLYLEHWADAVVQEWEADAQRDARTDFTALSPIEYEAQCARQLQGLGWTTRLTAASGDQGIDIIAERAGRLVVIQCKHYTQPVGNAAVQEALAGRAFLRADGAAVVSPAPFTGAARELAASTGVQLLHHDQLDELR